MAQNGGLGKYNIIAFVTIVDIARAKEFYRDTLGLRLVSEEPPFALVFDAHGIMLRLGMGKQVPAGVGIELGEDLHARAAATRRPAAREPGSRAITAPRVMVVHAVQQDPRVDEDPGRRGGRHRAHRFAPRSKRLPSERPKLWNSSASRIARS